jgi:hypothetical protein
MRTKTEDGKKKNRVAILIIGLLSIVLILAILAFSMQITNLQHHLTQANLTIAQAHSQILNLTHSLAQANATAQALRSNLSQAQATINMQKAQIANLTNLLNLNESQVIFNKPISIGPSRLISTCTAFNCSAYYSYIANMTLHFNFTHAGYIVINTTGQSYVALLLIQNYSKTWFGVNSSDVAGILNFSIRSLTMPVLPGPATLKIFVYNATAPYEAQLTITYHS